ncbi:MAG: hypothetical protein FWD57_10145 [Polyangiaceae bacterium]|nr:hypothetical protein [Polyangiaceae bacterium]
MSSEKRYGHPVDLGAVDFGAVGFGAVGFLVVGVVGLVFWVLRFGGIVGVDLGVVVGGVVWVLGVRESVVLCFVVGRVGRVFGCGWVV